MADNEVLGRTSRTVSSVSHRSREEKLATLCKPVLFWLHKSSCSCLLVMSLALKCPSGLTSTLVQTNVKDASVSLLADRSSKACRKNISGAVSWVICSCLQYSHGRGEPFVTVHFAEMSADAEERLRLEPVVSHYLGQVMFTPHTWHTVTMWRQRSPRSGISVADALVWCC